MSLNKREEIASRAMQAILSAPNAPANPYVVAKQAVQQAEILLLALKHTPEEFERLLKRTKLENQYESI